MTEPHAAVRDTSRAAARSLTDSALNHLRLLVYGFVRDRPQGATCDETEAALGLRHQTASARLRELFLAGWLFTTEETRLTRSRRPARIAQRRRGNANETHPGNARHLGRHRIWL
jgi:hypothetical protein